MGTREGAGCLAVREFDPEFEKVLRRAFDNAKREACPSEDELVAYYEGRLGDADASKVSRHIESCGLCDGLILCLRRPDHGTMPGPAAEDRIRLRVFSQRTGFGARLGRVLRSPLPGYALAAAFALAWIPGIWREPRQASNPFGDAKEIDLAQTRGPEASAPPASAYRSHRFLVIKFFVAIDTSKQYWVSLDGGPFVKCASDDALGNFRLVLALNALAPTLNNTHRIDVEERSLTHTEKTWNFTFALP